MSSEEKLNDFDKKLRRLDTMVTLLETKLNSLPPEITNNYPPLVHQSINDVNPFFSEKQDFPVTINVPVPNNVSQPAIIPTNITTIIPEKVEQEDEKKVEEDTPASQLNKFIEENPEYEKFHKMLKYGVPSMAIETKAKFEGMDVELIVVFHLLF